MSKKTGVGYAATVLLVTAAVLFTSAAIAMEIVQFDQMTNQDRQDFLDSLSKHAETVLEQAGRSADAQKVHHLFNDIRPGDNLPVGEAELELNLDNQRVRDAEKHVKNHAAPRMQVETALALTLFKNGIKITPDFAKSFMLLTGTFQPQHPIQVMEIGAFDNMADEDQTAYIIQMAVVVGTELVQQGKGPQARKVLEFFTKAPPGQKTPVGMSKFRKNLAAVRQAAGPRIWVEDVMIVTLVQNGFDVPNSFPNPLYGTKNFKPKDPLSPAPAVAAPPQPASVGARTSPAPPPAANDDDPIGPGGFITPPDR